MSNLGSRTLSYRGTRAASPVNCTFNTIAPTPYDNSDALYSIGDEWVYTNPLSPDPANPVVQIYKLVSLAGNQTSTGSLAHWVLLEASTDPAFFYQGNMGPQATPTTAGVLNIVGDGVGVKTVSDANHTITVSLLQGGDAATEFTTNAGFVFPDNTGNLNIYGGSNILTAATSGPSTVVVNLINSPAISGDLNVAGMITTGLGVGPVLSGYVNAGQLSTVVNTATAGYVLTFNATNTAPTWQAAPSAFTTGNTDAGAATVAAASLTFAGNGLLTATSGAGHTVTIGQQVNPTISGTVTLSSLGNGSVLSSATGVLSSSTPGAAGTILTSTGATTAPTWQAGGSGVTSFSTNNASGLDPVLPLAGVVTIKGDGVVFATNSSAHTVNIIPGSGAATNGALLIGGAAPAWNVPTCPDGTIVYAFTNGGLSIRATTGGGAGGLLTCHTQAGDVTVAAQAMTATGAGSFITTSGAGSTLTLGQVTNPTISGNVTLSGLGTGMVRSTVGALSVIADGSNGQVFTMVAGLPAWAATFTTGNTDAGAATVTASALTFAGNGLLTATSGAGHTVTIGQQTNPTISGNVTLSALGNGVVLSSAAGLLSTGTPGAANTVLTSTGPTTAPVWSTGAGGGGGTVTGVNGGTNINATTTTVSLPYSQIATVNLNNTIHWDNPDATHSIIFIGGAGDNTSFMHAQGTVFTAGNLSSANAFLGSNAGNFTLTSGTAINCTGLGGNSLNSLTTGSANTCIGFNSGAGLTTASSSTIVGTQAGKSLTNSSSATYVGFQAGQNSTVGSNVVVGSQAFNTATTSSQSVAIGSSALNSTTTGSNNTAVGFQVLTALGNFSNNTAVGQGAMQGATSAAQTCSFGSGSGAAVLTSTGESYYGYQSGAANTSGSGNAFYGFQSGKANTSSNNNTFLGYLSGTANVTGARNLFAGNSSGAANTTNDNVYLGNHAGILATTSTQNVIAGSMAAAAMTTLSSNNVVLGYQAANAMTSGCTTNVIIGQGAAALMTSDSLNNIVIGAGAGSAWR